MIVNRALALNDPSAFARDYLGAFLEVHAAQPADRQAALETLYVDLGGVVGWE